MSGRNLSESPEAVSVVGIGKLGAPISACFAHKGHKVIGVDVNPSTVRQINEARAPVFEPGLEEMLRANRERISATIDCEDAVINSKITFIFVPTPTDKSGGFSLDYVLESCKKIGHALRTKKAYHLVVLSSTVLPGATDGEIRPTLEKYSGKKCGRDFGLCYNPEFIALGSVIRDVLNPDFVLIGQADQKSGELLASFYQTFCDNNPPIARMTPVNAEITKLSVNTYVTTKITFANMIARLCERIPGADVDVVTSALGLDKRIGRSYLKGATGYGGPCFPRDNLALSSLARRVGAPAILAETTDKSNRMQVSHFADLLKSKLRRGDKVGILGLTYKPNTDVVEESQGLLLAHALAGEGIPVIVYDPAGMENARRSLGDSVGYAESTKNCVNDSTVIVITTPWEEFRRISPHIFKRSGRRRTLVDCWRLLEMKKFNKIADYVALGVGDKEVRRKNGAGNKVKVRGKSR